MASPFIKSRIALGCIAVLSVCVLARAQNPLKPLVPLPEAVPIEPAKPDPALPPAGGIPQNSHDGCIVLRDGAVRTGKIVELAAGYQITTRQGTYVFNYDQIRAVADSLPQAYEQIRNSYEKPTASAHLDLGQWCAKNGLMEEALVEAENALILEPTRKEAAELLRRAEVALKRVPVVEAPVNRSPVAVSVISSQAQGEFIRRIQPLALNKCGNGNCHGSGTASEFKLAAVRTGTSPQKVRSEQNLQAMLRYIDGAQPNESRLLVTPRTADGIHDGLFMGDRGSEQYKTLLTWVERVAREQGQVAAQPRHREVGDWREGPRLTVRPRAETLQQTAETESVENPPEIETVAAEAVSPEPVMKRSPLRSKAVQRLLENQAPDAFDPEEFNRMVHGDRPSSASSALPE